MTPNPRGTPQKDLEENRHLENIQIGRLADSTYNTIVRRAIHAPFGTAENVENLKKELAPPAIDAIFYIPEGQIPSNAQVQTVERNLHEPKPKQKQNQNQR